MINVWKVYSPKVLSTESANKNIAQLKLVHSNQR